MPRNRSKAMSLLLFVHFCCCARCVGGFCFESLVSGVFLVVHHLAREERAG